MTSTIDTYDSQEYDLLLEKIQERFISNAINNKALFITATDNLFDKFLEGLPLDKRQHYNCNACRKFINTYGSLVTIDENGITRSAMWDEHDVPDLYRLSVLLMVNHIEKAPVKGIFISSDKVYGEPITRRPVTKERKHLAVIPSSDIIYSNLVVTAEQRMASRLEDYRTLMRSLNDYSIGSVRRAESLLKADQLYRSEHVLGVAEWLLELMERRVSINHSRRRNNITWRFIAMAPTGYCHLKSTMIGTLLDDLEAGLSYENVSKRFAAKMNPQIYQRPQALPSEGNVQQAERIVSKLGAEGSLRRRYARLEEIKTVWKPKIINQQENTSGGVFGGIRTKNSNPEPLEMRTPPTIITWEKLSKVFLQEAEEIHFFVPMTPVSFTAILTAVDMNAPPIVQWDDPEDRNPFSWYVYPNGSYGQDWNLPMGSFVNVTGITLQPSMWSNNPLRYNHQGQSVIFILENARDKNYKAGGNGLFPEILRSEFHEIRSTIEEYSRNTEAEGYEESSACGVRLKKGSLWNLLFRVKTNEFTYDYVIDRWD